jgi:exonuclease III
MSMPYNFITINVRGLRNPKKRKSTFTWLKRYNCHFAFLQEVYCNDNDISNWEKEWGGTLYANHGTHHSRGVLIGIKNNVDTKHERVYSDNQGRLLCVKN